MINNVVLVSGVQKSNSVIHIHVSVLFQIYLKLLINLENSAVATGLEKISFHSNPKERQCQRMLKLLHRSDQISRSVVALIPYASKVMLKIFQARLQQVHEP